MSDDRNTSEPAIKDLPKLPKQEEYIEQPHSPTNDIRPLPKTHEQEEEALEHKHMREMQNMQYNKAFGLLCGCIIASIIIWGVGNAMGWPYNEPFDLLKTVATTALGFYIGRNYGLK